MGAASHSQPPAPFKLTWRTVALGVYVGSLHVVAICWGTALYRLWYNHYDMLGWALALLMITLTFIPIDCTTDLLRPITNNTVTECEKYFPVRVVVEDDESLKAGKPYLVAVEPHSVLPLQVPIVFSTYSHLAPKALYGKVHGMASSVCFVTPLIRQLYWALGFRPVSRQMISRLLSAGRSVVLCPGGVQECLYMQRGCETLFLRKRHGFVRMAMQHGTPLVPVFAFGQTASYSWWRPGPAAFIQWLSRQIGAVPLLVWGRWGTPLPHQQPITVVIGKPLEVPHTQEPSKELVDEYLNKFISEMEALIARHKKAVGQEDLVVRIM